MTTRKKDNDKETVIVPLEAKIKARIKLLEERRDKFFASANQQMAWFNGAIEELKTAIGEKDDLPDAIEQITPEGKAVEKVEEEETSNRTDEDSAPVEKIVEDDRREKETEKV